jgi:hypothetical protein
LDWISGAQSLSTEGEAVLMQICNASLYGSLGGAGRDKRGVCCWRCDWRMMGLLVSFCLPGVIDGQEFTGEICCFVFRVSMINDGEVLSRCGTTSILFWRLCRG